MNMKLHGDKIAYFFIAFAVYLLIRAFSAHLTLPIVNVLLYVSIGQQCTQGNGYSPALCLSGKMRGILHLRRVRGLLYRHVSAPYVDLT